jgi:hypothetical protein
MRPATPVVTQLHPLNDDPDLNRRSRIPFPKTYPWRIVAQAFHHAAAATEVAMEL